MKVGKFLISIVLVAAFVFMVVWVIGNSGSEGVSSYSISINEVMTSNKGLFPDPEGKFYDWVELYNGSNESADISGWGLSDDALSGVISTGHGNRSERLFGRILLRRNPRRALRPV